MLVGTDDCVHVVFVWEGNGGNSPTSLDDHMTTLHATFLTKVYFVSLDL